MEEEITLLYENNTWILVDKPKGKKLVDCKWIYKIKEEIHGVEKAKYKSRLVAKGFTQKKGVDYNEIFSPVVKYNSIRILLAMATKFDMKLDQMDVKTTFLHGTIEETIYMKQPEGFVDRAKSDQVYLLKRALYGLK